MTSQKTDIIAKFKSELSKEYQYEIAHGSTVTTDQKVFIDAFETELSNSFDSKLKFIQIDNEYTEKNGRKSRRAILNSKIYFTYEVGKEGDLINRVPEIIGILNDTKLKSVLLNF